MFDLISLGRRAAWAAALGFVSTLSLAAAVQEASAQEAPGQGSRERIGDWFFQCSAVPGAPPCEMEQVVTRTEGDTLVLRFGLVHIGGAQPIIMRAVVETGVSVASGVLVQVDGQEIALPGFVFTRCNREHCLIEGRLAESAVQPFIRGNEGRFVVLDEIGQPRVLPLSFSGFTAAFNQMKAANADWTPPEG